MMGWYSYKPYVSVATRRAQALKKMEKLRKKGMDIKPVEIEGRKIAKTFWGQAWCDHLESFSDYENRLPRGRTYVRNGSVCHLDIAAGEVDAMVCGTALYNVHLGIKPLSKKKWKSLKMRCAGKIGSLLELLQGKLSGNVMSVVTDRGNGLFPLPGEIGLSCTCPDWAVMCKHVAAVLYGVGARLDERPELLFLLRGVDHEELISVDIDTADAGETKSGRRRIADDALADVFGIEITETAIAKKSKATQRRKKSSPAGSGRSGAGGTADTGKATRKAATGTADTRSAVTGIAVAKLRAKLTLSQRDFAALLGVSTTTIANWEKNSGRLNIRSRSLEAFNAAKKLTKKEAKQKVDGARRSRSQ